MTAGNLSERLREAAQDQTDMRIGHPWLLREAADALDAAEARANAIHVQEPVAGSQAAHNGARVIREALDYLYVQNVGTTPASIEAEGQHGDALFHLDALLADRDRLAVDASDSHAAWKACERELAEAVRQADKLREALERIKANALDWHGPPENRGQDRALSVIAAWADDALSGVSGDEETT